MAPSTIALLFMAMLLAALLLEPLARLLRLPFSAALVAGGFAGSQLLVGMGIDTGLRWYHFHDLVFFVFLPALIFESALCMDRRLLLRNLVPILLLAVPALLLATALSAVVLYYGIGYPQSFPWTSALVAGVLLSATDPVAIGEIARRLSVPPRLLMLMEGESLFNDAATIVLFTLLLSTLTGDATTTDPAAVAIQFLRLFLGGLAAGLLAALFARALIRWLAHPFIITLLACYATYLIAEIQLQVSGVMAVLVCALLLRKTLEQHPAGPLAGVVDGWSQLGWMANSALFLLAGATITLAMFEQRWLAMLLGIAAALLSRLAGVWLTGAVLARLPAQEAFSPGYRLFLALGGQRGAVTLALALYLPFELQGWWTVQSITYGVVVFSLFVQTPLLQSLLHHLTKGGKL